MINKAQYNSYKCHIHLYKNPKLPLLFFLDECSSLLILAEKCSPSNTDWACCTETEKCSLGQGDCDFDFECQYDLICGDDNCNSGFPDTAYDCCEQPPIGK